MITIELKDQELELLAFALGLAESAARRNGMHKASADVAVLTQNVLWQISKPASRPFKTAFKRALVSEAIKADPTASKICRQDK